MEFLLLTLAGLGGIVLHILVKFRDLVTKTPKQGQKFKARLKTVWNKFDLLGNLSYGIFALVVVIICSAGKSAITEMGFPITFGTILGIGYAADSFIKNIKSEKIKNG
jgi:peptidoglycan/LPS O-acetylase OafA/YrhL